MSDAIGQATMLADGTIVVDLYRPALLRKTLAPSDPAHAEMIEHVGGLTPGEQKLVPPWPDGFDAVQVETAVHAYIADKKQWDRDRYEVVIEGEGRGVVVVRVQHRDDRRLRAPGGGKSFQLEVDSTSYEVKLERAYQ